MSVSLVRKINRSELSRAMSPSSFRARSDLPTPDVDVCIPQKRFQKPETIRPESGIRGEDRPGPSPRATGGDVTGGLKISIDDFLDINGIRIGQKLNNLQVEESLGKLKEVYQTIQKQIAMGEDLLGKVRVRGRIDGGRNSAILDGVKEVDWAEGDSSYESSESEEHDYPTMYTARTMKGGKLQIEVKPTATVGDLKKALSGQDDFDGAITIGGNTFEDDFQPVRDIHIKENDVIRLIQRLHLKMNPEHGHKQEVTVLSNQQISYIRPFLMKGRSETLDIARIFCRDHELDDRKTFAFHKLKNDDELRIETKMLLNCLTTVGPVRVYTLPGDAIGKLTLEIVIAARLDPISEYQILCQGAVLREKSTVALCGLTNSSALQLNALPKKSLRSKTMASASPQHFLSLSFQAIIEDFPIIPTQVPAKKLIQRGFQSRFILDLFEFYSALLAFGRVAESPQKVSTAYLTLFVKVMSWGTVEIDVSPSANISEVKGLIEKESNIPVCEQRLHFAGQMLVDTATLESYHVRDCDALALVIVSENSYFLFPPDRFDNDRDHDFTQLSAPPDFGVRGGEQYYPPCGWMKFGLKVSALFDSDLWLGMRNGPGEWIVSYHSYGRLNGKSMAERGRELAKGKSLDVESGMFSVQDSKEAEQYSQIVNWDGRKFKIAFQNRVNPQSVKKVGDPAYFISPIDRDIRPFGVLIKQIT